MKCHLFILKVLLVALFIGAGGIAIGQVSSTLKPDSPVSAAQVSASNHIAVERIPHENFKQLTPEKQAYVLSHPEQFVVLSEAESPIAPPVACHKKEVSSSAVEDEQGRTASPTKHKISKEEYQIMPLEKRQRIDAHPELYIIE